ncbi:chromate efflux transporter [Alishewanella tabrizica]|uniref:Chromate transporter n=2 Tax=Alishewanella tabrizica TaxID=671278 RepID=A0ABQ2WD45_9ALTE|nr:chromate transporter [Alishewanella tabrizica]
MRLAAGCSDQDDHKEPTVLNEKIAINPMTETPHSSFWSLFRIFLVLGLTSFGGPVAHLGYFRTEFVEKRKWLSERDYAELVALCQFLPGPASSQVGLAIGLLRGHYRGALAAWLGFTLPSALLLILFSLSLPLLQSALTQGVLHGLKLVAVAVVAHAVWGMAKTLCNTPAKVSIMTLSAVLILLLPMVWLQPTVILLGALLGYLYLAPESASSGSHLPVKFSFTTANIFGLIFLLLLFGLPLFSQLYPVAALQLFDTFYRAGALVFGGGHVVLPLLQAEVVPSGLVDADTFLAGYAAAQAVPGPLFTFAAFLGASANGSITGITGGVLALLAIFLPSFLVLAAVLPYWQKLRSSAKINRLMAGVGASVTGILLAALYQPIWLSSIFGPVDLALALIGFIALQFWRRPAWQLVLAGAMVGGLLTVIV